MVYPTFAVVAGSGTSSAGASAMGKIGTFNFAMLVHGTQAVTLHRPIPVEAQATIQDKVVAMYDKGKAAVVVLENEVKLATGEPLFNTRSSLFIRGEGPGLSRDKGVPLQFVSIGKWRWETNDAAAPIRFRILKNDTTECVGLGEQSLEPGYQAEFNATF